MRNIKDNFGEMRDFAIIDVYYKKIFRGLYQDFCLRRTDFEIN